MMTTKAKILVADQISAEGTDKLQMFATVDLRFDITRDELIAQLGEYDALVVRSRTKVTAEVVAAGNHLKVIGRAGVGVDNIDLEACRKKNIMVVNSPNGATIPVAEFTLGLIFSLLRKIPAANSTMKDGQWSKKELKGENLQGKTLGLIGVGRIGAAVAERSAALGMRVLAYDPYVSNDNIKKFRAVPAELPELVSASDILSIHTPYTDETHHFINTKLFNQMKKGVYLVCAARGGVVDENALLTALNSGQVAGAALDVFSKEPPGLTALISHPNVVVSPHIGAQTYEAQIQAGIDVAEEIYSALKGEPLRWRVV